MKFTFSSRLMMLGTIGCVLASAFLFFMSSPAHRASAANPSYIRVIHASPDIGTATVFVDGNMLLNNFQFGTVTPYATVPAGPHKVQVGLIGTGPGAATITQTIQVDPGIVYTVAALGTTTDGFKLQIFIDNNVVNSGSAKLRVYHLSPGTGSVSVANGSTTLINSLSYQQASDYLTEPAGTYNLNLNLSSSQNTSLPVSANLSANTVTSIFAIGLLNGTPKLQTISAQVAGLPNVPGTGSDPTYRAVSDSAQPMIPWLPEIVFALLLGGFFFYRMRRTKRA